MSRRAATKENKATKDEDKIRYRRERKQWYTLMVYEDADATLLRLYESFMESAPQLVLQIYILINMIRCFPDAYTIQSLAYYGIQLSA